jgi:Lar family restriction alleviation protein
MIRHCPFCGGADVITPVRRPTSSMCDRCGATGPVAERPSAALAAWSRRVEPPPVTYYELAEGGE